MGRAVTGPQVGGGLNVVRDQQGASVARGEGGEVKEVGRGGVPVGC